MFSKTLKDTTNMFMMEGESAIGVNAKIVHIDFQPAFCDHISEDVIHESLECGWSIAEAKEHNHWFKQAKGSDESCFPLVQFLDVNVVILPLNVKFDEVV